MRTLSPSQLFLSGKESAEGVLDVKREGTMLRLPLGYVIRLREEDQY